MVFVRQREGGVSENSVVPPGLESFLPLSPALKRWAKLERPSGLVLYKLRRTMQKITPFLWFDGKAEEAMNFYVSVFKNSKVVRVSRYGEAGPGPKGAVMSATFVLEGQDFYALNGGPQFKFTPAISLFVSCEAQQEVDDLWDKLSAGGSQDPCG